MSRTMQVLTVIALAIFWAVNWPIMKIGLTLIEPWTFRAVVVLVGGVGCLITALSLGRSVRIPAPDLRPLLWLTLFQGIL